MNNSELMQEVENLKSRIEELEKELENVWGKKLEVAQEKEYPANGTTFYYLNYGGLVVCDSWGDWMYEDTPKCMKLLFDSGEIFLTKEDAEEYAEVKQIEREVYALADDNEEWDGSSLHFTLIYDYDNKIIDFSDVYYCRRSDPYFASKESAKAAVEEVGEERVAKWLTYKRTRGNNK